MADILYIAAKAPRNGFAKTRLSRSLGPVTAIALYRAFLTDLAARFASAPFDVGWYVTPADAWTDLEPLVGRWRAPTRVLDQGDGDWTARQRRLFAQAAERRDDRVVLMSSDSPQVPVAAVIDAFDQLDRHDIVLGAVLDGGYYLIGMRRFHDVLAGVQMSTSSVFDEIVQRAGRLGLAVGQVAPTFDIDEASDLAHLGALLGQRDDLAATRAAMASLGLADQVSAVPGVGSA